MTRTWDGKTTCPRYAKMDKRWVLKVHVHPSANCYAHHGCACPGCLQAVKIAIQRRAQGLPGDPPPDSVES